VCLSVLLTYLKRHFHWYVVHTQMLLTFHARVEYISFFCKNTWKRHTNQWEKVNPKPLFPLGDMDPMSNRPTPIFGRPHSPPPMASRPIHAFRTTIHKVPISYNCQWDAQNSPPKLPLPLRLSPPPYLIGYTHPRLAHIPPQMASIIPDPISHFVTTHFPGRQTSRWNRWEL